MNGKARQLWGAVTRLLDFLFGAFPPDAGTSGHATAPLSSSVTHQTPPTAPKKPEHALQGWSGIKYFSVEEFPMMVVPETGETTSVLRWMHPDIPRRLDQLRELCGTPLHPSPLARGHVRWETSGSRHSADGGRRLSDGVDVFVGGKSPWSSVWYIMTQAERMWEWGGIGFYVDTLYDNQPRPMLHLDLRPDRLKWVRYRPTPAVGAVYVYHNRQPAQYHEVIAHAAQRYV